MKKIEHLTALAGQRMEGDRYILGTGTYLKKPVILTRGIEITISSGPNSLWGRFACGLGQRRHQLRNIK